VYPPPRPPRAFPAGTPISIGIVLQASMASKQSRLSVVYTLSDLLRGLHEEDEAFILSYGSKVNFDQDLTWNYELLEQAMDRIDNSQGSTLLDAVGFAAYHMQRVAKNENRVILVISDGTESGSQSYSGDVVSLIRGSGARVLCIGIGALDSGSRDRLQELASIGSGQVTFISRPEEFRAAAHSLAASLGIYFQQ
jgi:predicted phosphoribosyltransferase